MSIGASFRSLCRWGLTLIAVGLVSRAQTPDTRFSQSLQAEEKTASGVQHLTAAQIGALDSAVEREVKLATQGDVVAFSGTFSDRRTENDRAAMGITTLTAAERRQLDECVARAIANHPKAVTTAVIPPSRGGVETYSPGPIVHGSVTFAYLWNSQGGSAYGGAIDIVQTDPAGRYTLGISYSELRGDIWGGAGARGGCRR